MEKFLGAKMIPSICRNLPNIGSLKIDAITGSAFLKSLEKSLKKLELSFPRTERIVRAINLTITHPKLGRLA